MSAPDPSDRDGWREFILANTKVMTPPHVPEIRLHLAEESVPIWQKTEDELGAMNVPPPFWAFAWAGGQALARYLLDNPAEVAGRSVIDLGTGSGLAAIAAKLAGARTVLAADIDQISMAAVDVNAAANGVSIDVTDADLLNHDYPGQDVLLVGDLFYERQLGERVLAYCRLAAAGGARVLIGDPHRSYFPRDSLVRIADYEVPVTRELEDALVKRSSVWSLVGPPSTPAEPG